MTQPAYGLTIRESNVGARPMIKSDFSTLGVVQPRDGASATYFPADTPVAFNSSDILFSVNCGNGALKRALTAGVKGDLIIPYGCTILDWSLLADQAGSVVVDIWKTTFANFPPTVANTIVAGAKPTLTAATKSQSALLTGWTTSVSAGDILRFNVDSAATATRVTLALRVVRT